jgi:hypothetical protein
MKIIIAHAAWFPERKRTLGRLIEQLGDVTVIGSRRREHASVWAHRAWEVAEEMDEDTAILNDDVLVCDKFVQVCEAMVAAAPGRVLSLHTSVPDAATCADSWIRCYWLTGPGYILPKGVAAQLLDYAAALPWQFVRQWNEDNVAIQWAWERQEPFWSSIPAVVSHDTETKSTLGYDNHKLRSSCVPFSDSEADLTSVDYWKRGVEAPMFVENPWAPSAWLQRVRHALQRKPCQLCWQEGAIAGLSGFEVCAPCLAKMVGPVLNSIRAAS